MKGIYWLASYPKSGNTWVRCFIAALLANGRELPSLINQLEPSLGAASREVFDRVTGEASADLYPEEIARLRPRVYAKLAEQNRQPLYIKIHDAPRKLAGLPALLPVEATLGIIHIVRNPLDLAVSYANHRGRGLDGAIAHMADAEHGLCQGHDRLPPQLPQFLGSWSAHAEAWMAQQQVKNLLIRYEDLWHEPQATFTRIALFLGLPYDATAIAAAVERCSFERLRQEELSFGFRERPANCTQFFHQGRIGTWRDRLDAAQITNIVAEHRAMMLRLGYLGEQDSLARICG